MNLVRSLPQYVLYTILLLVGGFVAWRAAPDIEAMILPPFADEYLMPFAADRPDVLAERQLDRICWRVHVHKLRKVKAYRRSITFVLKDGTRIFVGGPLDGRTGEAYSSRDAALVGYNGNYPLCAYWPNSFDANQDFRIESFGQYSSPLGPWLLDHDWPTVNVPATPGDGQ